ncbi:MAG: DUF3048 domain-containing protein [Clostridiales bacterium]|nr:DUF3048 domain-containing protein [Clostridiales bacterium]
MLKKRLAALALALAAVISCACTNRGREAAEVTETAAITKAETAEAETVYVTETEPETAEETTTEETTTEETTTEETTTVETTTVEITTAETTAAETTAVTTTVTTVPETTAPPPITWTYLHPLTGLPADRDWSGQRPAAIMINNVSASLPQPGISKADVIYECLVEGGMTRLLALVQDYASLGVIGSVRSSREYYLDLAANHDAIYVHAGGSDEAYRQIKERGVNNLDGVNMYLPDTFYRDPARLKKYAYEHTLVTTGRGIVSGIKYRRYRTGVYAGFKNPLSFCTPDKVMVISDANAAATNVIVPYNKNHRSQYVYDASTMLYSRYQYVGEKHIDGTTGEQLAFTNLLILCCDHAATGDEKGHITVDTTGSDRGYACMGGRYVKIKWSKPTADSAISFTYADGGAPLVLSCGKTMINIVSPEVFGNVTFR